MRIQGQKRLNRTKKAARAALLHRLYREVPVSIDTFIDDPKYMGSITHDDGGYCTVWPRWRHELRQMFVDERKYINVLTGAIGIGKTRTAILALCYVTYRILCYRNPQTALGAQKLGKLTVVFFNLTKSMSDSRGYGLFQEYLLSSPWFLNIGTKMGSKENPYIKLPFIDFRVASPLMKGFGVQGLDVIAALMDEVDNPEASEKHQKRVVEAFDSAYERLKSRFVYQGKCRGRFFLVASKQDKVSFLNTFIAKMQSSPVIRVVDMPQWEAQAGRRGKKYCGKGFMVSVGDPYHPPKIIETRAQLKEVREKGFQTIIVPVEEKDVFQRNIVTALRDVAGISVSHVRSTKLFPAESSIMECMDHTVSNPCKVITIKVGLHDDINFAKYIDFTRIQVARNIPRFIHQDFSYSGNGDATGLAMSCLRGWTERNRELQDGTFKKEKLAVVETDFVLRIKAHPGDRIPQHRIRQFILDLRDVYKFNIMLCTFDLRVATEDGKQILERAGVACDYLSMDTNPQYYREFRNMVFEERWHTPFNPYLFFELKHLEDDLVKNKIDHPEEVPEIETLEDGSQRQVVLVGSKDCADAVAGSVIAAIKNTEMPPDVEVMTNIINKMKPAPMVLEDDLGFLDVKRVNGPKDESTSTMGEKEKSDYLKLLSKTKGLHRRTYG
jgi:hypothetical protein